MLQYNYGIPLDTPIPYLLHLYKHNGGIIFCYAPIVLAVAIVSYSFKSNYICYFFL